MLRSRRAFLLLPLVLVLQLKQVQGGASAYHLLDELEQELDAGGAIVEVGSDRGEGSTGFLSGLANRTNRQFFTVDFSREGYENARSACGSCARQGMGEKWLENSFPSESETSTIALAYLDNYDWTYPWTTEMSYKKQQKVDYTEQGLELSNQNSQEAHLRQAIQVEKFCTERCFVLFDDTWPSAGSRKYSGKGGMALSFLFSHGFELIQQSDPDTLSHMGWVLVRRLPAEERHIDGDLQPANIQSDGDQQKAAMVSLLIASPEQRANVVGTDLEMEVVVANATEDEHVMVVLSGGVEVIRVSKWDQMVATCFGGEDDQHALQSEEADQQVCHPARKVPLYLNGAGLGPKVVDVQVVDADHKVVASQKLEVTMVDPSG